MLRKLSLISLFALCILLPASATFEDDSTGINIVYDTVDGGVEVKSIGDATTRAIDELIIPDEVTYEGETYKVVSIRKIAAFLIESITSSLVIGNNVVTIGLMAFNFLMSCESITFGRSVETIEEYAFGLLTSCESITSLNTTPPTVESGALQGLTPQIMTLYVPYGCKEAYSSATTWKDFTNIVEYYPAVQTGDATDITNNSATLNGSVTAGSGDVTEKGFKYWTDEGDKKTIQITEEGKEMTTMLSNLEEGTTYYYYAYAITTDAGTSGATMIYGETITFTTLNATLFNSIVDAITEVETQLSNVWETIENDYPDVADNYKDDYESLKDELEALLEELDDAYNNGTLTDEKAEDITSKLEEISEAITDLLTDAAAAEENFHLNDAITSEIEDVQSTLEEAWETIQNDYPDVADNYKDDYESLKGELEALLEELDDAYNNGTLTDEKAEDITSKLEEINEEINDLLTDAAAAEENSQLNDTITEKIEDVQNALEEAWETIENDYPDVADNYKDDYESLKDELEALLEELDDAYNNGTLTDDVAEDIISKLEELSQEITDLLAEAAEEHGVATRIGSLYYNFGDDVQVYDLSGTRVNTPTKGNVYIVRQSDGTTKKVFVN